SHRSLQSFTSPRNLRSSYTLRLSSGKLGLVIPAARDLRAGRTPASSTYNRPGTPTARAEANGIIHAGGESVNNKTWRHSERPKGATLAPALQVQVRISP
ncbi:MAG TPA: hypothetical protein VHM28_06545, partial [Anaerolineales bacterium]|nr:hypothetical protein [Anaerolineales bacterium]